MSREHWNDVARQQEMLPRGHQSISVTNMFTCRQSKPSSEVSSDTLIDGDLTRIQFKLDIMQMDVMAAAILQILSSM